MTYRIDREKSEAAKWIPNDDRGYLMGVRVEAKAVVDDVIEGHRYSGGDEFLSALWKGDCERYWYSKYDGISYDRPTNFQAVRDALNATEMVNKELWLRYLDFIESDPDLFIFFSN